MLSVTKLENKHYTIYKFYIECFGKKPLFAVIVDKVHKISFISYETKEYIQNLLNIRSHKELDEVSKYLDKTIREIVRKYIKRNNLEDYEVEKFLQNILKDLESFLKDFLLLQSI